MRFIAIPVKFNRSQASINGPAPALDQHTEEILLEMGNTSDNIAQLKCYEVIIYEQGYD